MMERNKGILITAVYTCVSLLPLAAGLIYLIDAFADIGGTNGAITLLIGGSLLLVIVAGIYSYAVADS